VHAFGHLSNQGFFYIATFSATAFVVVMLVIFSDVSQLAEVLYMAQHCSNVSSQMMSHDDSRPEMITTYSDDC